MKEAPCQYLAWDSDFFGFSIARVVADTLTPERLNDVDAWCVENGVYCLYFRAKLDHGQTIPLAERGGFNLVNVRVLLLCPDISPWAGRWGSLSSGEDGIRLRLGREADVEPLSAIASDSFRTTRFAVDPRFPRERVNAMYADWVRASFGGFADALIVAELDGKPVGFTNVSFKPGVALATLGIIAVEAALRGHGIGSRLIGGTHAWLAEQGATQVQTATQGQNRAAQRLFLGLGYLTNHVMLDYHKWYMEPGTDKATVDSTTPVPPAKRAA